MNEQRKTPAGQIVTRTRILGTSIHVYAVWEESRGNQHSTITYTCTEFSPAGRIGTRRLPAALDALPALTDERIDAVTAWHAAQYAEAYAAILQAYPEAGAPDARRSLGEIETYQEERP